MPRDLFLNYFDDIEQRLIRIPNLHVEQFNAVIISNDRANLKLDTVIACEKPNLTEILEEVIAFLTAILKPLAIHHHRCHYLHRTIPIANHRLNLLLHPILRTHKLRM